MSGINWPGNASPPLAHLSGWSASPLTIAISTTTNPETIYNDLKSRCNGTEGNGQKIKRPTVAWTRSTAPLGTNQMRPNHAYSVLGVFYQDANNKYIVLRNPIGRSEGTSNPDALVTGSWGQTVDDSLYYPGGGKVAGRGSTHRIDFNGNIGIFALKTTKFRDYFSGYSLV